MRTVRKLLISLLNIHYNIIDYGQDASTDKTFLHSKTPKHFMLRMIFLFHADNLVLTSTCITHINVTLIFQSPQ